MSWLASLQNVLRVALLGPLILLCLPVMLTIGWLGGDASVRHWPRWLWQLVRYGEARAVRMP